MVGIEQPNSGHFGKRPLDWFNCFIGNISNEIIAAGIHLVESDLGPLINERCPINTGMGHAASKLWPLFGSVQPPD